MKVTFLSDNLQKKISFLNHAVSSRGQLPILSNFLLEAKEGKLIISATDLENPVIKELIHDLSQIAHVKIETESSEDIEESESNYMELVEYVL